MARKFVFHVGGGAAAGGKTLTCRANEPGGAAHEANLRFHPRRTYGPGMWTPRAEETGPDPKGDTYLHADWKLESER